MSATFITVGVHDNRGPLQPGMSKGSKANWTSWRLKCLNRLVEVIAFQRESTTVARWYQEGLISDAREIDLLLDVFSC